MALKCMSNLYRCGGLSNFKNLLLNSRVLLRNQHGQVEPESMEKPVAASINNKLMKEFNPVHLEILNESYMHNVPKGSETHFKVTVVSEKFENLSLIKRHRLINDTLKEELETGVHALSIQLRAN